MDWLALCAAHGRGGQRQKKLIEAAVQCADDGEPPPVQLRLHWWAEAYHVPPEAGGMLDQDYNLITTMRALASAYSVVSKYRNAAGTQIHALTDSDRMTLRWLMDEGVWHG